MRTISTIASGRVYYDGEFTTEALRHSNSPDWPSLCHEATPCRVYQRHLIDISTQHTRAKPVQEMRTMHHPGGRMLMPQSHHHPIVIHSSNGHVSDVCMFQLCHSPLMKDQQSKSQPPAFPIELLYIAVMATFPMYVCSNFATHR